MYSIFASAKPFFEKKLQDIELNIGKPAKFEAIVTGLPQPEIIWKKDDNTLVSTDRVKTDQKGNVKTLTVKQTATEDVGVYSLYATNEVGEESCATNLNVRGNCSVHP